MKTKLLSSLIIIFIVINIYSPISASNKEINKDYNLLMPDNDVVTSENTILLSGKAKSESNIDIYLYNHDYISNIDKSLKKPTFDTKLKVGELERFNLELELPLGKNEIIVVIENNGEKYTFDRIVNVTNRNVAKGYIKNRNILEANNNKKILKSIIEKK
ncbi:MAG: hypothetical protein ACTHVE_02910 [Senegalia sp. (in: firmicutes)]|uniref:hypothetical protein n=1 Tax=Senegalia sp. (in: firmicutes) TaxID=1924098 RepID=UPI003F9A48F8